MADMDRFWSKVRRGSDDECWLWTAAKDTIGYGNIRIDGKLVGAHRVAWMLAHGPVPDGVHVLHTCDVRACVNPAHLFLGTHQDNMADRQRKGRSRGGGRRGVEHWKAALNDDAVRAIRRLRALGWTQTRIADRVGVSRSVIAHITQGNGWRHVA